MEQDDEMMRNQGVWTSRDGEALALRYFGKTLPGEACEERRPHRRCTLAPSTAGMKGQPGFDWTAKWEPPIAGCGIAAERSREVEREEKQLVETHPIVHDLAASCRIQVTRWLAASAITLRLHGLRYPQPTLALPYLSLGRFLFGLLCITHDQIRFTDSISRRHMKAGGHRRNFLCIGPRLWIAVPLDVRYC